MSALSISFPSNIVILSGGYCGSVGPHLLRRRPDAEARVQGRHELVLAEVSEDGKVMVVLDTRKDEKVLSQKLAREIFSRTHKLSKKSGLQVGETVKVNSLLYIYSNGTLYYPGFGLMFIVSVYVFFPTLTRVSQNSVRE